MTDAFPPVTTAAGKADSETRPDPEPCPLCSFRLALLDAWDKATAAAPQDTHDNWISFLLRMNEQIATLQAQHIFYVVPHQYGNAEKMIGDLADKTAEIVKAEALHCSRDHAAQETLKTVEPAGHG